MQITVLYHVFMCTSVHVWLKESVLSFSKISMQLLCNSAKLFSQGNMTNLLSAYTQPPCKNYMKIWKIKKPAFAKAKILVWRSSKKTQEDLRCIGSAAAVMWTLIDVGALTKLGIKWLRYYIRQRSRSHISVWNVFSGSCSIWAGPLVWQLAIVQHRMCHLK